MTDQQDKIVEGLSRSLPQRQARWDRVRQWTDERRSLAQMVELEESASGMRLSRERIRAIKNGPRPGSVGRPKLPGLRAAVRAANERVELWKRKPKTDFQREKLAEAKEQLAQARVALRAEERRVAK